MFSIFASDLAQYRSMVCKLFNITTFFGMRNSNGSITNFHIIDLVIFTNGYIITELVANKKGFKQSASKINWYIIGLVHFNLFAKVGRNKRSAEAKLYNINMS